MRSSHTVVRAFFAAILTTLLAALTHLGAGGHVSPVGLAIVFVLVMWAATILAGRRLGYASLSAVLGLGQALVHVSMGWFTSVPVNQAGTGRLGAHMHHVTGSLDLTQATAMHNGTGPGATAEAAMIAAHLGAVVVTAAVLKHGEDTVLRVLQLALGPVATVIDTLHAVARALTDRPLRCVLGEWRVPQAVSDAVIGANHRRGPPAVV